MLRKAKFLSLFFLFLAIFSSFIPLVQIDVAQAETVETAVFRPYALGYAQGTHLVNPVGQNTTSIDREINLEGWDVSKLALKIGFCSRVIDYLASPLVFYPPAMKLYISTDRGETYPYVRVLPAKILVDPVYWEGYFYKFTGSYEIDESDYDLFTPETRIMIEYPAQIAPQQFFPLLYWGDIQEPVPPYDYIDDDDNYVQYDVQYVVEYTEQEIEYTGSYQDFSDFPETYDKMERYGDMILDTLMLSGAGNEVVLNETNKLMFGTSSWIVMYSNQIAMMELLELCGITNNTNYLLATKRFITWMWSKQNTTDGSFPFILTDGDQHCWYNETSGYYYGYDKIDSFSACAISLMRVYYEATGDLDFVNSLWSRIHLAKGFVSSLVNTTSWVPVDGYHYDGSIYTKSESNWLHDCCEAWKGISDFAYLEGVRGNTSEQTYWDNYANLLAQGIRNEFWNETLGRYVGIYNVVNDAQTDTLVYNIITPLVYGICDNETRASMTLSNYCSWGLLSGRYLDYKWAEDYSVYNEYSTMAGMMYKGFFNLYSTWNYTEFWAKIRLIELGKFLFSNPVYPDRDLQNEAGVLDYVNMVEWTWAAEYARLVETSSWLLDGFMELETSKVLFNFTEGELAYLGLLLKDQDDYWGNQTLAFTAETGYLITTVDGFEKWVDWLKEAQIYVQWYDYKFLKKLYENNYIGENPWWEEWQPDDDWLFEDTVDDTEEFWNPEIFQNILVTIIHAFLFFFFMFAPPVALFLLKLGKFGIIVGSFIGVLLVYTVLPLLGFTVPDWILFIFIAVIAGAAILAFVGGKK